jgi:Lhr-like helicase
VFTNTRSQAELWLEGIASVWPHAPESLAIHHGSLDRGLRRKVEEAFAARLKPGDRFLFAGRHLEFMRARDMTVWVKLTKGSRTAVPRWMGGRLSLSNELGHWLRLTLPDDQASEPEMRRLKPLLALQRQQSRIRLGRLAPVTLTFGAHRRLGFRWLPGP